MVSAELDKFPVVSDMSRALRNLFDAGNTVQMRVLEIMGLGLELDDPQFLAKKHQFFCKTGTLRSLHYPRLNMKEIKENQVRCGEHSDYGSITLLFQDGKAGLQVRNVHDEWVKAPPIEGTILVNIGDLMQRWTSDRLIASKHRVMLPTTEEENSASRQSIALFGHPDDDEIIACLDGSNKYPPIGSKEYLEMRFSMTY
ncbi:hypothetical protein BSL78_11134 [Apostichopus japonicus]|uniref:Fe2OG dioxygenase domain-containing protein n=1 Tax=Stichopus japonicus TaxID=307972 RepID=A0A2G8KVE4_STIJA|nr:hypothetical protein BSL78_11134 [Apostichopus japonicus]